jgi:RimJ/RimL family protein N-acetyltransferase
MRDLSKIRIKFIPKDKIAAYQDILNKLDHECFPEDPIYNKNDESDGDFHVWWLVYKGNLPIGYCGLRIYKSTHNAFFCRTGVSEKYRNKGINKELIKRTISWAKSNKINRIYTYTSSDNYPSMNSLIKHKFKITHPWFEYENYKDFVFLYRNICGKN